MKFIVSTSGNFYNSESIKSLKELGFKFSDYTKLDDERTNYMENDEVFIEINNLDELLEFQKKFGDLIISEDNKLEIYDDYRE